MNMERSLFFGSIGEDRKYVSKDFAMWMAFFFSTGVSAMPKTVLQVTAGGGLTLNVQPGGCNIKGRIGINENVTTLTVDLPDGYYNRIDSVILRLNSTERAIQLLTITGTPDLTPVPPALIRNDDVFDLCLAHIAVAKGAESVTAADITDKRTDETVCGLAAANMPLDTAALFAQYSAIFNAFMNEARDTLGEDAAGNLFNLINTRAKLTQICNPNVLDNWDFTTAINQNRSTGGVTFSTVGWHVIDRWMLTAGSVIWTAGVGIALAAGACIRQYLEKRHTRLLGKVFTVSAMLTDGTIKTVTGSWPTAVNGASAETALTLPGVGTVRLGFQYRASGVNLNGMTQYYVPFVDITATAAVTLAAVKTEKGDCSTLDLESPMDYTRELAKCKRYHQRVFCGKFVVKHSATDYTVLIVPHEVAMRITPTASVSQNDTVVMDMLDWGSQAGTVSAITAEGPESSTLNVVPTSGSFNAAVKGYITGTPLYAILNADL